MEFKKCKWCGSQLSKKIDLAALPAIEYRFVCSLCGSTIERIEEPKSTRPVFGKKVR